MTPKYYGGIGSRNAPKDMLVLMYEFAYTAAGMGYCLRSGAAEGADRAFEMGCDDAVGAKQIFLPWKAFNDNPSELFTPSKEAHTLASTVHPVWSQLAVPAQHMVARNMHQVLGPNLDQPVSFVVCWTKDGAEDEQSYSVKTGGTGTAICLASRLSIPVFNFRDRARYAAALEFIQSETANDNTTP